MEKLTPQVEHKMELKTTALTRQPPMAASADGDGWSSPAAVPIGSQQPPRRPWSQQLISDNRKAAIEHHRSRAKA